MDLAIGPKIANLASRHSERDEGRHVIEMRPHFLHGVFGPTYEMAAIPSKWTRHLSE
jgi:hypothetical protein